MCKEFKDDNREVYVKYGDHNDIIVKKMIMIALSKDNSGS